MWATATAIIVWLTFVSQDRRQIEQQMFSGQLLGIVATTALELGIDIGSLDAVLTVGFPYTMAGWVRSMEPLARPC